MSQGGKCRILFVEDEAMISLMIEDMLLDFGVEVVGPASTLSQAWDLARTSELDAAILDIKLREEVTYSVADLLRSRGVPFIFATGYGTGGLPSRFSDTPILHKPFNEKAVGAALKVALASAPCEIDAS